MRTRFLPINDAGAQTLDFVHLPLPHLSPPDNPPFSASFRRCIDEIPILGIYPELEKLPIEDALSMFLSDVIPDFIDCSNHEERNCIDVSKENHEVLPLERSGELCYGETQVVRLGADKIQKNGAKSTDGDENGIKFVQFEIPDMNLSLLTLESATHSEKEVFHIFSQISDSECTMLPSSELRILNQPEIQQSVYSVDDMSTAYSMEEKADLLEDRCSIQEELHSHIKFPLFEVDEESLGITGRVNMVDELLCFESIEKQQLAEPDLLISKKELLGSVEFDFIKDLLHHCVAKGLDDTYLSPQLDHVSIIDLSLLQEYPTFPHGKPEDYSVWSVGTLFDEFLFFDLDPYNFHDVLFDAAKEIEGETCGSMFEAMNFKSLNELIVSHELTLMDDSFKSLPVPILSDHGHTWPLHLMVEELFTQLDWQSSSASDGLYLDWHYLGEDGCDLAKYSSCWKMLWDIETYNIDTALNLSDSEKLMLDFIIYEDTSNKQNTENNKEMLNLSSIDVPIVHTTSGIPDTTSLSNHGGGKTKNEEFLKKRCVEKVPLYGESMSSDLEFFLNPRTYATGRENMPGGKSIDVDTTCQVLMSSADSTAVKGSTVVQQKWNLQLHQVKLSDTILLLINYLWKHFLALLENDKELIQIRNQYQAANDLTLLLIPKEKFMSRLREKMESSCYLAHNDDDVMVLVMLCAIKQMAFYLCYYGVQVTFSYMDKLSTNLPCMKSKLSFLYNLIRDEHEKSDKELNIVHPSISIVQEILQTSLSNSNSKILIVAEHVFWWPLKRLMNSLKISYSESQHFSINQSQQHHCCEISDATIDLMLHSDCCLVPHNYISASFPFSKFSFILEYGGSYESSRISSICPKLDGIPTLHFVKVELEESSIARALCYGVDMPKNLDLEMKNDLGSTLTAKASKSNLDELLNTIHIKEAHDNGPAEVQGEDKDCTMMAVQSKPVHSESKQNLSCKPSCLDTVIIVNTRNFSEEMVISRRSTYQRILEMEKHGTQVIERDIGLPVDLIISAAISLTWYDCRNIGKKASAPDEAVSCLPLCVESIAASILTSLSFAFNCCILIFEGEISFLGSIMESSDELYAAAASLGVEIQVFCSYSSEMTEEIILSCINVAANLSRGLYPKMSDSESLAESFLTSFPSINPLSAHAILSSGDNLNKFLDSSNEGRICALQKYQVPDESVSLLSATSKYGEREDCKSGVTECSSSVSSVPESENLQFKGAPNRKKLKYTHDLCNAVEPPNGLFHMESLNLLPNDHLNPPKRPVFHNSRPSRSAEILENPGQLNSSSSDKLFRYQEFDAKGIEISDDWEKTWIPGIDIDLSPGWESSAATTKNFSRQQSMKAPGIPQDKFIGEVIDVEDTPAFEKQFSAAKSISFSPSLLDTENDYLVRNSRISELPLRATKLPAFTSIGDIDSPSDAWFSGEENKKPLRKETGPRFATIERKNIPVNCQRGLLEEDKAPHNSCNLSFHSTGARTSGGTPLSNALHSTRKQQGSPWTIEFLNRIREKSRLHQQAVSCNLSSPCFGFPENTSKATKRKSPSIFESYKYKGASSTPKKIVEKQRIKRSSQPPNSLKAEKDSVSSMQAWTPVDKRARGTLSFSTNGSGGQSQLVWRHNTSHASQRRF